MLLDENKPRDAVLRREVVEVPVVLTQSVRQVARHADVGEPLPIAEDVDPVFHSSACDVYEAGAEPFELAAYQIAASLLLASALCLPHCCRYAVYPERSEGPSSECNEEPH